MTSNVIYKGELRTEATHQSSQAVIITDAPRDNHGKGNAFSPTDLVATALGSCMLTIMGIKARELEIDIEGAEISIYKRMDSEPRRIVKILVAITMPKKKYTIKDIRILEKAAIHCPVAKSLSPDIEQQVSFAWT